MREAIRRLVESVSAWLGDSLWSLLSQLIVIVLLFMSFRNVLRAITHPDTIQSF